MKLARVVVSLLALVFVTTAFAESNAEAAFEKLKSLQGSWSGKGVEGGSLQVSFRVVSGGSAVMSEIQGEHEPNMITLFHLDGDRLLMTHYCGAGNQPRMVGTMSADGKTIDFKFLDATNLLGSQPGHMEHLTMNLLDANHHNETWSFESQGAKAQPHTMELQRAQ